MALVEFKDVNKYYGDYHALRNINLEFEPGQVVVLLGPSGSGKSTLIRTINGLEAIDEGTLIVNGHDISSTSIKELVSLRKEVGMVFQHFNLYPHKTVLEKVLGINKATAEKPLKNTSSLLTSGIGRIPTLLCYPEAKTTCRHCSRLSYETRASTLR